MDLTLASYNMHYGLGPDGRYDIERIAGAVACADIICLQEVTQNWPQTGFEDQLETLAALLNRFSAFGPMLSVDASTVDAEGRVRNRRATFGNAVLSRWPIRHERVLPLPKRTPPERFDLQRVVLEAVIDVPGLPLRVYSVHLSDISRAQRAVQVAEFTRLLAEAPATGAPWDHSSAFLEFLGLGRFDMPADAVVLGDLNFDHSEDNYANLLAPPPGNEVLLQDAWIVANGAGATARTYALDNGHAARIDHCLLTPGLAGRVDRSWIDSTARGSDHYPLFVTLRI